MTLIEAVSAIVVLGIAIPPLVGLFREVAANTVDHTYQGVGVSYAAGLMEEIVSKAYEDPDLASGSFGTEEGSRSSYDDIDDYDGLSNSPPQRLDGTALADYGGFTRSVKVDNVTGTDPDAATPSSDGSTDFKRIQVTVAWIAGRGGEFTLKTLRTKLSTSSGPLDEAASAATASKAGGDKLDLDLVSISSSNVVIQSFVLSADVSTAKVKKLELDDEEIWEQGSGVDLPTGTLTLNKGSTGDRTIAASASPSLEVKFKEDPSGTVTYTLVLTFTDGTSSTITFTIAW